MRVFPSNLSNQGVATLGNNLGIHGENNLGNIVARLITRGMSDV